jgi:hypothetical protein
MAVKGLIKPAHSELVKVEENFVHSNEEKVQSFISQGGSLAVDCNTQLNDKDHRLTLRIPKSLLDKVDVKRKQRVGSISRNLWILELIQRATQK